MKTTGERLIELCGKGRPEDVGRLLSAMRDPANLVSTIPVPDGLSAMARCIDCNDHESLELLLEFGLVVQPVNFLEANTRTPLGAAIENQDSRFLERLIEHGVPTNAVVPLIHGVFVQAGARKRYFLPALMASIMAGNRNAFDALIEAQANPMESCWNSPSEFIGALTQSPFSDLERLEILDVLINNGLDIPWHTDDPIQMALKPGDSAMAHALLDRGTTLTLRGIPDQLPQREPLSQALRSEWIDKSVIDRLIAHLRSEYGDLESIEWGDNDPLDIVISKNNPDHLISLLEAGWSIDKRHSGHPAWGRHSRQTYREIIQADYPKLFAAAEFVEQQRQADELMAVNPAAQGIKVSSTSPRAL